VTLDHPRRVLLLVNPTSGRGRATQIASQALNVLRDNGITAQSHVGSSAADITAAARAGVAAGVDTLVAVGGDGTLHAVLPAVVESTAALGLLPCGTGDDAARALGIPRGDADRAIAALVDGAGRATDVGVALTADGQTHYFVTVLSCGFDSCVNERANLMTWPRGQARYLRAIVAELGAFKPVPFSIGVDAVDVSTTGMLVAVGNGPSYGGGMKVCPSAKADDGELAVTVLGEVPTRTFLRVFPRVFSGSHVSHPSVKTYTGTTVRVDAPGMVAYADGERLGPVPVEVSLLPGAIRVLGE